MKNPVIWSLLRNLVFVPATAEQASATASLLRITADGIHLPSLRKRTTHRHPTRHLYASGTACYQESFIDKAIRQPFHKQVFQDQPSQTPEEKDAIRNLPLRRNQINRRNGFLPCTESDAAGGSRFWRVTTEDIPHIKRI